MNGTESGIHSVSSRTDSNSGHQAQSGSQARTDGRVYTMWLNCQSRHGLGVHLFPGVRRVCLAKSRDKTLLNAHRIIQTHLGSFGCPYVGRNCQEPSFAGVCGPTGQRGAKTAPSHGLGALAPWPGLDIMACIDQVPNAA
jgi:hypothetical protein